MTTNIAIACQGGGSHTAFTAGVLSEVLPSIDDREDCRLVGLSGSSGGAVSALAGWYGYLTGGGDAAVELLDDLWADVAVSSPYQRMLNQWVVWGMHLQHSPAPTPSLSPYHMPFANLGKKKFCAVLERHIDFDRIPALIGPDTPELIIGAVDVNAGEFDTFTGADITVQSVLASCAVPSLFEAVEIDGHYHWDGLFSQNPPIYELMHTDPEHKPDELWVVQINPQRREREPRTLDEIADRRNELSGNISMNQELRFVETVNRWIDAGALSGKHYNHTEIRRIILDEQLDYPSKLDRSADFLDRLLQTGRSDATAFLDRVTIGDHEDDAASNSRHDD